ncbi:MAG TPA: hypothetical protein PLJ34_03740 [Hyphomicrobiales bacterium]|nr:hypothetical protein [Kaistiaceae bacterium]HQF30537.1 hypothetical protein [Hyphomicrobiales bacterium]
MQQTSCGFPILRRADGGIDYDRYRAIADREHAAALAAFWTTLTHGFANGATAACAPAGRADRRLAGEAC